MPAIGSNTQPQINALRPIFGPAGFMARGWAVACRTGHQTLAENGAARRVGSANPGWVTTTGLTRGGARERERGDNARTVIPNFVNSCSFSPIFDGQILARFREH